MNDFADETGRFGYLLERYLAGEATRLELEEFATLAKQEKYRELLQTRFGKIWNDTDGVNISRARAEKMLAYILASDQSEAKQAKTNPEKEAVPLRPWKWVAAAAVVISALGYGVLSYYQADERSSKIVLAQDIKAGGNKAILEVSDGLQIELNGKKSAIPQQGVAELVNQDGKLAYLVAGTLPKTPTEIVYNTLSTPRGGQYQLTLADGSNVWLNAASSLKFPAVFSGSERVVELIGEAYFEIAILRQSSGEKVPFKVRVRSGAEVEVLGTHFNVMAYDEEQIVKTTLLEGSIKLLGIVLLPNQQAQVANGQITVVKNIDTEEASAWRDGYFLFNKEDIHGIMRKISRWYDVEIEYSGEMQSRNFTGSISRFENVSEVLRMLETTGAVHFTIEGRKIIVAR